MQLLWPVIRETYSDIEIPMVQALINMARHGKPRTTRRIKNLAETWIHEDKTTTYIPEILTSVEGIHSNGGAPGNW